jgi:hypothetical protein
VTKTSPDAASCSVLIEKAKPLCRLSGVGKLTVKDAPPSAYAMPRAGSCAVVIVVVPSASSSMTLTAGAAPILAGVRASLPPVACSAA